MSAHATIVAELSRLFAKNKDWDKALEKDKSLARVFRLEQLISSPDSKTKKIGIAMGSLIMARVQGVELADIVDDETSMAFIN